MAVLQDTRSTLTSVLVDLDKGEADNVPAMVRDAYRAAGGSMPIAVVTDPGVSKVYGAYSHGDLRSRNFRQIFNDARRDFRRDNGDGSIPKVADVRSGNVTPGASSGDAEDGAMPAPAATSDFSATGFASWTSAQGSTIEARINGVDGDRILFLLRDGRQIPVAADQLDTASLDRARETIEEIIGAEFARPQTAAAN